MSITDSPRRHIHVVGILNIPVSISSYVIAVPTCTSVILTQKATGEFYGYRCFSYSILSLSNISNLTRLEAAQRPIFGLDDMPMPPVVVERFAKVI